MDEKERIAAAIGRVEDLDEETFVRLVMEVMNDILPK